MVDTRSEHPISQAMLHTMKHWSIPVEWIEVFLGAMRQDLTKSSYADYLELQDYMYGSAAVIGLQMLPILQPLSPEAARYAQALGEAFQLSNFIRDVGEDLRRGRIYLPQDEMRLFGVSDAALRTGVLTAPIRRLLAFQVDRARRLYRYAEPGIALLHPTSRPCIRTAFTLYQGILDEVEDSHYPVLGHRAKVPTHRRLSVYVPAMRQARAVLREESKWVTI
jgi:phytoene synthase